MRDLTRELEELGRRNAADVVAPPVARLREAGDRRRRRRHVLTATGAVAGAGLVLAGVLALGGPGPLLQGAPPATTGPAPTATAAPPPPSTTDAPPASVTTPPVATTSTATGGAAVTDRPAGYGAVRLGMTVDEAVATGEASVSTDALPIEGCTVLDLAVGGTAYASDPDVVNAIFFGPQMQTSTGLRIGATLDDVLAAYPGASVDEPDGPDPRVRVDVRAGSAYAFSLDGDDRVSAIELFDERREVVCTG